MKWTSDWHADYVDLFWISCTTQKDCVRVFLTRGVQCTDNLTYCSAGEEAFWAFCSDWWDSSWNFRWLWGRSWETDIRGECSCSTASRRASRRRSWCRRDWSRVSLACAPWFCRYLSLRISPPVLRRLTQTYLHADQEPNIFNAKKNCMGVAEIFQWSG